MLTYSFFVRAFALIVWSVVFAGSLILLRRGYASAAVSMLLGAAIALLMGLFNLVMTIPTVLVSARGVNSGKIMMMTGLISLVGMFLFALGFLQFARMTKREG